MTVKFCKFLFLFAFAITMSAACQPSDAQTGDTIGLEWQPVDSLNQRLPAGIRVYHSRNDSLPLRAWYVEIAESDPAIETRVVMSADTSDNRESVADFARRLNAIVAVNAGYFTMDKTPAGHVGLLAIDGKVLEPATRSVLREDVRFPTARAAIGFAVEGGIDIDWVRSQGDSLFALGTPLPNLPGNPAAEPELSGEALWKMRDAIGAGPMLIESGTLQIASDSEVFFGTSIPAVHPRTAAGYREDGTLLLLVVDGRQAESRGVSLEELAQIMAELGAFEALNLDGGGSSTLVVDGVLLNRPVGGTFQREVMSALAVFLR